MQIKQFLSCATAFRFPIGQKKRYIKALEFDSGPSLLRNRAVKLPTRPTTSLIFLVVFLICWTRIGFFGLMPVGGDASRFGLGLMAEQSRAMAALRIPLWNSLWGYGFPALAESQLGVFYPPHLLLYSLLPLEAAYSFDMAFHALWAAVGAWLLARRICISPQGASLTGIAFAGSGFFLVHLPHHWGFTTGSWLPWIFYAGLRLAEVSGKSRLLALRWMTLLAFAMAMPVLTGHFQLGFISMVSLGVWWLFLLIFGRKQIEIGPGRFFLLGMAAPILALWLTLVQVWPTAQLANLANQQRDWEYLSGFALPPTHLVGLLAPAFGRTVSFWRPLFWDQFHSSPEELFFYVGLVPLGLALSATMLRFRQDHITKTLVFTLIITLILAFGPYFPGFNLLIRLPGFSFFRAPARWTLASTLMLALLAGQGLDLIIADFQRVRRAMVRLSLAALLLIISFVILVEGVIGTSGASINQKTGGSGLAIIEKTRVFLMPAWADVRTAGEWVRESSRFDAAVIPAYAKPYTRLNLTGFSRDRQKAWLAEVGPAAAMLAVMAGSLMLIRQRAGVLLVLCCVSFADFFLLFGLRPIETAPIGPIADQSPMLRRLGELSSRQSWPVAVIGDVGNLPMAVGASPLRAYRTLDIPVMPELTTRLAQPFDSNTLELARLAGVGFYLFDPPTWAQLRGRWTPQNARVEEIDDPTLWAWLTTSELARRGNNSRFGLVILNQPVTRAWHVPVDIDINRGDFIEQLIGKAQPLEVDRPSPENLKIQRQTDSAEYWMISQWADPSWQAELINENGKAISSPIIPLAGGWQAIKIPGPGRWTLGLSYKSAQFSRLLFFSGAGWCAAVAGLFFLKCKQLPQKG